MKSIFLLTLASISLHATFAYGDLVYTPPAGSVISHEVLQNEEAASRWKEIDPATAKPDCTNCPMEKRIACGNIEIMARVSGIGDEMCADRQLITDKGETKIEGGRYKCVKSVKRDSGGMLEKLKNKIRSLFEPSFDICS